MSAIRVSRAVLVALLLSGATATFAQGGSVEETPREARSERRAALGLDARGFAVSAGVWDFGKFDDLEIGVDYGFGVWRWWLVPRLGLQLTDQGTVLVHVGLRRDFPVGERWSLTPSFAAGYWEQGDGKDLGNALEFRSGLEITRRLPRGGRIGIGGYHVSNASRSERNPGANSILLRYRLPPRR